jgi:hypothetical protein
MIDGFEYVRTCDTAALSTAMPNVYATNRDNTECWLIQCSRIERSSLTTIGKLESAVLEQVLLRLLYRWHVYLGATTVLNILHYVRYRILCLDWCQPIRDDRMLAYSCSRIENMLTTMSTEESRTWKSINCRRDPFTFNYKHFRIFV